MWGVRKTTQQLHVHGASSHRPRWASRRPRRRQRCAARCEGRRGDKGVWRQVCGKEQHERVADPGGAAAADHRAPPASSDPRGSHSMRALRTPTASFRPSPASPASHTPRHQRHIQQQRGTRLGCAPMMARRVRKGSRWERRRVGRARARACRCAWQARAPRPATPCVSGRRRLRRDGSAGLRKLLKLRLIVAAARPPRQLKKRTPGGIETGGTDRGISEPGGCLETANTPPRLGGASAAPAVPELSGAERSRAPRAAAAAGPGLPPRMRGFGPLSYGNSSRPYGHDDSCAAVTAISSNRAAKEENGSLSCCRQAGIEMLLI